jgi:hypothetical protein
MHTIQAFLTVVLCGFVWLTIILGLAVPEEVTNQEPGSRNPNYEEV